MTAPPEKRDASLPVTRLFVFFVGICSAWRHEQHALKKNSDILRRQVSDFGAADLLHIFRSNKCFPDRMSGRESLASRIVHN